MKKKLIGVSNAEPRAFGNDSLDVLWEDCVSKQLAGYLGVLQARLLILGLLLGCY